MHGERTHRVLEGTTSLRSLLQPHSSQMVTAVRHARFIEHGIVLILHASKMWAVTFLMQHWQRSLAVVTLSTAAIRHACDLENMKYNYSLQKNLIKL